MGSTRAFSRPVSGSLKQHQMGFALPELAVALLASGLIAVAAYTAHTSMKEKKDVTDAATLLQTIDTSIRSFVLRESRLPCPSEEGGVESKTEQVQPDGTVRIRCTTLSAGVPFVTLGIDVPGPSVRTLRYGVSVGLIQSISGQPQKLLDDALALTRLSTGRYHPYVAQRNADKVFANCDEAAANPAYTLMWLPTAQAAGPNAVPPLCFRQSADQSMGLLAIGGTEFLGWLMGNLRL